MEQSKAGWRALNVNRSTAAKPEGTHRKWGRERLNLHTDPGQARGVEYKYRRYLGYLRITTKRVTKKKMVG